MGDRTWPNLIAALLRTEELSTEDTAWAMGEIMSGSATPAQIASFAIALRAKGETPGEIAGLVGMIHGRHSMALQPKHLSILRTSGDLQPQRFAGQRFHLRLTAKDRGRERH